jgi:hypothetical protein
VPARIAQALAPWLFGLGLQRWGAGALILSSTVTLLALVALACVRAPRATPPVVGRESLAPPGPRPQA